MKDVDWLLGIDSSPHHGSIRPVERLDFARSMDAPSFLGARLSQLDSEEGTSINEIDLDKLREIFDRVLLADSARPTKPEAVEVSLSPPGKRKLVLMGIRELGNKDYYHRPRYKAFGPTLCLLGRGIAELSAQWCIWRSTSEVELGHIGLSCLPTYWLLHVVEIIGP